MKIRFNCAPLFFFFILMRKCFVLFFRRLLPTQNLPPTSADLYTTPQKKEKERKHQKERHKQINFTITRQSSLIQ